MITKGGITGLPENDFYKRQKSGDWTIDEHFRDVNYIRTKNFTPDTYLAIGEYQSENLTIYDIFNEQVSSLTTLLSGGSSGSENEQQSIVCVDYNRNINRLAIGLNKSPFLRIFNTFLGDEEDEEEVESSIIPYPIFSYSFTNASFTGNEMIITHNFNDPFPALALLTTSYDMSCFYEIEIINSNQVKVIFETLPLNISGIVYIYSYINNRTYSLTELSKADSEFYQLYRLDTSCVSPLFQFFDTSKRMIIPRNIYEITPNQIYDFEFPIDCDLENTTVLMIQGYDTYNNVFTKTDQVLQTINHRLGTRYLFFQLIDLETNEFIYPKNINIVNFNSITIDTTDLKEGCQYKIYILKSPPSYIIRETELSEPPLSMVTCLSFDNAGDRLIVGVLESENNNNLICYNTTNYDRVSDLAALNALPTTINIDQEDNYLFVGHYNNLPTIDRNLSLYDYSTKEIISDYNFNNLKTLTSDSVTCSCFVSNRNLLVIGNYYDPFISFYNYVEQQDLTSEYNEILKKYIISRVTNIIKTIDDRYLLIAVSMEPYLILLDLKDNVIKNLPSDLFNSSFTSMSLSVNDRYLCVSQRDEPHILLFEFSTSGLMPVDINFTPTNTVLVTKFFFAPISSE